MDLHAAIDEPSSESQINLHSLALMCITVKPLFSSHLLSGPPIKVRMTRKSHFKN